MAIVATFGNQKGGVGKSTLINQLANYIYFKTEYDVAVIDGDFIQESLSGFRANDIKLSILDTETKLGKTFTDQEKEVYTFNYNKNCYKLVTRDSKSISKTLAEYYDEFDFVLIDLPGSLIGEGSISIYPLFDYVFVPMNVTFKDMDSSKKFQDMYNSIVRPHREIRKAPVNIFGVYNRVKENTTEFKEREIRMLEMGITFPFLKNYITETTQLQRDDNSHEVIKLEGLKNPNMINNFCIEILELMLKDVK